MVTKRKPIKLNKNNEGAFTRKAKSQGLTPKQYAIRIISHQRKHPGSKRYRADTIKQAGFVYGIVMKRKDGKK